jgi:hypothetical protein
MLALGWTCLLRMDSIMALGWTCLLRMDSIMGYAFLFDSPFIAQACHLPKNCWVLLPGARAPGMLRFAQGSKMVGRRAYIFISVSPPENLSALFVRYKTKRSTTTCPLGTRASI